MRTRLALLATLVLAALLALPTAALAAHDGEPGHHGSGTSGSPVDHSGTGPDHATARTPATPTPEAGPPVGRVADRQGEHSRLSTTPTPTPTPTLTPSSTPTARGSAATPAARASTTTPGAGTSALTPTSLAVAAAALVLVGMVAAGFRARARLGRLG